MDTGLDDLRGVLARRLPDADLTGLRELGRGYDNVVLTTDVGTVYRFAVIDPAGVTAESTLIGLISDRVPLPVPQVTLTDPELGLMVYAELPGRPLAAMSSIGERRWTAIADALAGFLRVLHAIPVEDVAGLVEIEVYETDQWLDDAADEFRRGEPVIPARLRPLIQTFLLTAPPPLRYLPTFLHNDLGTEHIIVDPTTSRGDAEGVEGDHRIAGIIDWTDAAVFDPAYDLGLLCRDVPTAVFDRILSGYRSTESATALRDRAVFYARCSVLEDIAYGVTKDLAEYRGRGVAALNRLFEPR